MSAANLTLALGIVNSDAFKAFLKWIVKILSNRFYYFCKICGKNAITYCKNVKQENNLFSRQKVCKNCCPCKHHHSETIKKHVKKKKSSNNATCSNPSCPNCNGNNNESSSENSDEE